MDENRLFGNNSVYVRNMGDLIVRDRNHPSIVIWSFCNEMGCEGDHEYGGPAFQSIATKLDGSRPTLANMFTFNDLLSNTIDIQGFSHENRAKLDDCHSKLPNKPILVSLQRIVRMSPVEFLFLFSKKFSKGRFFFPFFVLLYYR
jgi:beta-galactosidase/beta-glucuronidase